MPTRRCFTKISSIRSSWWTHPIFDTGWLYLSATNPRPELTISWCLEYQSTYSVVHITCERVGNLVLYGHLKALWDELTTYLKCQRESKRRTNFLKIWTPWLWCRNTLLQFKQSLHYGGEFFATLLSYLVLFFCWPCCLRALDSSFGVLLPNTYHQCVCLTNFIWCETSNSKCCVTFSETKMNVNWHIHLF